MTRILIARILGPHGIKGQVKIKSFTTEPKSITTYGPLHLADGRVIEITKLSPAKDHFICTLKNVTDRNQSETLKGELFVDREKLPVTDEIYLADLEGKAVVSADKTVGEVTGFQNFGAGDLMELDNGVLVPVRFVKTVGEVVDVELPDGFLDSE
jgi:16S rRNA processing protein RimM